MAQWWEHLNGYRICDKDSNIAPKKKVGVFSLSVYDCYETDWKYASINSPNLLYIQAQGQNIKQH